MRWSVAQSIILTIACLAGWQFLCAHAREPVTAEGPICPSFWADRASSPSITIADLTFTGDPKIGSEGLNEIATELKRQTYRGTDSPASEMEERARRAWQDRGYFKVQVQAEARVLTSSPMNQRVSVTLHLDAGDQYRLAGITFRNNRGIANSKALRNLFSIKDGEIFQRSGIVKGLENLRHAYLQAGYVNATSVPDTRIDEAGQTISLEVDIDEGKQFSVTNIRVVGVDEVTSESFLQDLPLQPGKVYNQRLAEYFFKQHASLLPAGVSPFARIHLDLDERAATVAVTIDVRPCTI